MTVYLESAWFVIDVRYLSQSIDYKVIFSINEILISKADERSRQYGKVTRVAIYAIMSF